MTRQRRLPRPAPALHAVLALFVLLAVAAPSAAQPGASPTPRPGPQHPVELTAEEHELLAEGEIDSTSHIGGAIIAYAFGFGIGQAVQGRYTDTGYIFTIGEAGSAAAFIVGIDPCVDEDSCTLLIVGAVSLVAFRIWEIVDAFAGPARHNRRVRAVRRKAGQQPLPDWSGVIAPTSDGQGLAAGLTWRF